MAFVSKQTAVFLGSASITLDNNNDVLIDFWPFSLYTLPHTSVGPSSCISIFFVSFEYFDLFDHDAAFNCKSNIISDSPLSWTPTIQ